jgi:uncharacterized membrane protein YfcA
MELSLALIFFICGLFFIVAFLYSSVGHGGASGYLAVLSFFAFAPKEMSTTALLINILVASIAFFSYVRAGHFSFKLIFPFLISSIPFAFIGGMIHVSTSIYTFLLSGALLFAAFRLIVHIDSSQSENEEYHVPPLVYSLPVGGGIGLLSGIVGVGGGIFLSPLMLLLRWADPKRTSAASALFIVMNSIAGIVGRQFQGNFAVGNFLPFMAAAVVGGIAGSWWGARKFSNSTLRRLLGIVLIIAAVKLVVTAFK